MEIVSGTITQSLVTRTHWVSKLTNNSGQLRKYLVVEVKSTETYTFEEIVGTMTSGKLKVTQAGLGMKHSLILKNLWKKLMVLS